VAVLEEPRLKVMENLEDQVVVEVVTLLQYQLVQELLVKEMLEELEAQLLEVIVLEVVAVVPEEPVLHQDQPVVLVVMV
jgi:hypothetical protein